MFNYTPASTDKLIAGRHFGKRITITPQAEPIWNELVKLANQGNYWAQMSVNGIKQLAAGRLSQKNIFVKPGPAHRAGYRRVRGDIARMSSDGGKTTR
ncbi:hypothetical protein GNX18_09550 [Microbulbifer sp. SH-1]|uniref:hypothetical protein n=1 Tax=Microbulbifer sp. SH-1 TaxID=2681547 RepID=UPI00140DA587|nr:hypothetical protein [Microbulbifer sp. SH-1]QIL89972.1 hypothetical protein GNX18_09550 [Microbulbifer sp. SH-1]